MEAKKELIVFPAFGEDGWLPGEEDQRQKMFEEEIGALRREHSHENFCMIPMNGFPASKVNLGWIADRAQEFTDKHQELAMEEVGTLIVKQLDRVVQRLKSWKIDTFKDRDGDDLWQEVCVNFQTKDDKGWYGYEFSVARHVN